MKDAVPLSMTRAFAVRIRWRNMTWNLRAFALDSAALIEGLAGHFGPQVHISVQVIPYQPAN